LLICFIFKLVAIEKREKGEEKKQGPSVADLVEKENVDELPYIGWTELLGIYSTLFCTY